MGERPAAHSGGFALEAVDLQTGPVGRRSMCSVYASRDSSLYLFGGIGANGSSAVLLADSWRLPLMDNDGTRLAETELYWHSAIPFESVSAGMYS